MHSQGTAEHEPLRACSCRLLSQRNRSVHVRASDQRLWRSTPNGAKMDDVGAAAYCLTRLFVETCFLVPGASCARGQQIQRYDFHSQGTKGERVARGDVRGEYGKTLSSQP